MKKQDAERIRPLVTNLGATDALEHYLQIRLEALKESLVTASDMDFVVRVQGAINEIKRFRNLRDEVLNANES